MNTERVPWAQLNTLYVQLRLSDKGRENKVLVVCNNSLDLEPLDLLNGLSGPRLLLTVPPWGYEGLLCPPWGLPVQFDWPEQDPGWTWEIHFRLVLKVSYLLLVGRPKRQHWFKWKSKAFYWKSKLLFNIRTQQKNQSNKSIYQDILGRRGEYRF